MIWYDIEILAELIWHWTDIWTVNSRNWDLPMTIWIDIKIQKLLKWWFNRTNCRILNRYNHLCLFPRKRDRQNLQSSDLLGQTDGLDISWYFQFADTACKNKLTSTSIGIWNALMFVGELNWRNHSNIVSPELWIGGIQKGPATAMNNKKCCCYGALLQNVFQLHIRNE